MNPAHARDGCRVPAHQYLAVLPLEKGEELGIIDLRYPRALYGAYDRAHLVGRDRAQASGDARWPGGRRIGRSHATRPSRPPTDDPALTFPRPINWLPYPVAQNRRSGELKKPMVCEDLSTQSQKARQIPVMARQFYLIGAGRTRPAGRRSPPRARAQPRVQAYSSDFASESKPRVVDLDCAPHRIVRSY